MTGRVAGWLVGTESGCVTGARMEMEEVGGRAGTERGAMPIFVKFPWVQNSS